MAQKRWLHRLGTGILTAGVGLAALGAARVTGTPDLATSLIVAGSIITDPAAAVSAAGSMMQQVPAVQTDAQPVEEVQTPQPTPVPDEAEQSGQEQPQPTEPPQQTEPPQEAEPTTEKPENAGQIVEQHYNQGQGGIYVSCGAGTIKNVTSLSSAEITEAISAGMPFAIEVGSSEPQVLIMHTHTTETFELEERDWYDLASTARSTDLSVNMAGVGQQIAEQLNAAGIVTLHDTTLHDYPSYNGSYERSNATVQSYLQQYPSIKVVLDVHRDAIEPQSGQRVSAIADINGQKAAQVMIICGADKNGNLPNFKNNLAFAAAWQNAMESRFPGLTRPVLFDYRYYNQDLTTGSLLIEIGSHGNTLAQAIYSGQLVGQALVGLFTQGA